MTDGDKLKQLTSALKDSETGILKTIEAFTDARSFIETDRFTGSDTLLGSADGEGAVCGFASIENRPVGIFATNPAVLKGGIGKRGADKIARLIENSIKTDAPVIGILDTEGARFAEGIEAVEGYAKIIKALSGAYGAVPVFIVNKGKNFGLSSYLTGICDLCIGYDKSELSTASPLIISAAAGADASKTGSSKIHQTKTGLYSAVVKSDKELKDFLIKALGFLCEPAAETDDDPNRVSKALKEGAGAETLIKEIFDTGSFLPIRSEYAPDVVTGFARLDGIGAGVVAFNKEGGARISSDGANKITELISTCESFGIPLISLVDCIGSVVDLGEENGALIREVANLAYFTASIEIAKIALITGSAIGAGYSLFASKSVSDYTLAYPGARIGALESAAAAELLYSAEIIKAKNKESAAKKMAEAYAAEHQAAVAVAKDGFLDNIIEPAFSRPYLVSALRMFKDKN